ncbi:acyl-CoA carboxylase subunit epsilon [Arthrobacter sp. L77]|uniref:acyl-CoA carboxylase subunit epsilon n=1 Tax=Arthrobacter sp. L77 TaxID=1496689 RepID=UPI00068B5E3D|nr:acyl-CoA carboxylase subunit epsilon [Arthrobacter sp. L77]
MTGQDPRDDTAGARAGDGAAVAPPAEDEAVLSVVSGNPTDEELAALTAVVVALQGAGTEDDGRNHRRSWVRRALLRLGPTPGPGSWRRSVR